MTESATPAEALCPDVDQLGIERQELVANQCGTPETKILKQISAISSLIGYVEGGLSVFENSAETPSEDWLNGLREYCDRASDATEEILAIASSTANHTKN